ncbi:MAG: ABC transporter, partial [Cyanobacteria bacterium P01_G01_bin.49]
MKNILTPRKILKYLFIPGLILTVAGLVAGTITGTWNALHLGLVIAGGIFLIIWLVFLLVTGRSFWQKRSTQAGTNALVSTISLVAILGLMNFLVFRY